MPNVVTLVGYRASGKSSVAPKLARKLGWSWIDSDSEIERRTGCTIRDIFDHEGEAGFRARESEVLSDLLQQSHIVIASGGGAVLSAENRRKMQDAGPVVWLNPSHGILVSRLSDRGAGLRRPSLTGKPIAEEVAEVMAVREPLYRECATLIVQTDNLRPDQVAKHILTEIPGLIAENPSP
jgi:shikimate kinase